MNVPIAAGSTLATPTGGRTLFINTEDGNILSWKHPDGTVTRFSEGMTADCCACEIAKSIADAMSCGLKNGTVTPTEYSAWILQGVNVHVQETDDGNGNKTCNVDIGTKDSVS